jgi:toxin ParE1/3/4
MREIRISEAAESDFINIWATTFDKWGMDQADRYLDDIDRSLKSLAENPFLGPECSELLIGARRLLTGRHLAFYEVSEAANYVIRVLHQSMDVQQQLRAS